MQLKLMEAYYRRIINYTKEPICSNYYNCYKKRKAKYFVSLTTKTTKTRNLLSRSPSKLRA